MEKKSITIIFLLAVGLLASRAFGKSASALLQEGLYAEEIEGDLDGAIKIYEEIIAKKEAEKPQVAQAMYRMGMCYFKKRNEGQAKAVFEKLVAQFPEENQLVEKVRPLLEEMSNPDPAMLMPPETKIYVEFGSPGRQVETILNMLKGTPFENPLAAIGGGGQQPQGEQKTPGDIMAALLNPSMTAEFKKIRGMAIGVTDIQNNNPPLIVVLFPGRSDALRGIFLAALGVAGKQGESIGDMQTIQIGTVGAAYDDNAIIIAQPLEQLKRCVKQYKGVTAEPSLISENKVFAKLSRKMREDNAVTVWLDGAATFAAISEQVTESGQKAQFQLVDGIADFNNIKEVVSYTLLQESNITAETTIGFKDGHNCLAYDFIRTPNLSRDGFKAVPSEAVGVASFALGESEGRSSESAQKAINKLTGLDIGREIFSNVEQITVFALPPKTGATESETSTPSSNTMSCLGLAVTSRNPVQTRQLLTQVLTVVDLAANASMSEQSGQQSNPAEGKYKVGVVNKEEIYCYIGQADNTTILALSEEVLKASLSALKSGECALTGGPLQKAVSELPGDTSKVVLVNVGGAIRIADSHINWAFENPYNPVHPLLEQLAQACDKTSVQSRTGEKQNSFNLRCSLDEIPPLGPVFPLLMQVSQLDFRAKAEATCPEPADGVAVGADTKVELSWKAGIKAAKHKVYFGTDKDELPLLAEVNSPSYTELPTLEKDTKYYWRIDEVWAEGTVITGDVWSFSTGKLVGWWKFDEGSGNTASDSSGNGYNGTLNNMDGNSWVDGITGGALKFDGMNDYVSIPALGLNSNTVTITAWIKRDGRQAESYAGIVYCRGGSTTAGISFGKGQDDFYNVNHELAYNWNDNFAAWNWHSGLIMPDNEWVFVALVVEPSKATMYLGEKGTLSSATNKINHAIEEFDGVTRIGNDAISNISRYFRGWIDDVRIYNYALPQVEVEALYKKTRPALAEEAEQEKAEALPEDK
jgi:hypothetical protein